MSVELRMGGHRVLAELKRFTGAKTRDHQTAQHHSTSKILNERPTMTTGGHRLHQIMLLGRLPLAITRLCRREDVFGKEAADSTSLGVRAVCVVL